MASPGPAHVTPAKREGKKKNVLGLNIPLPPPATHTHTLTHSHTHEGDARESSGPASADSAKAPLNVSEVMSELDDMEMDSRQRARLEDFLFKKSHLLGTCELKGEDFEPIKMLGYGNGGSVWKVRHKPTNLLLARKMIHLEIKPEMQRRILRELRVLHECNSPDIVGFFGSFCSDGEINILMEYMDGGSLDKVLHRVGRFPEDVLGHITRHILTGLTYLRDKQNIIHRDVKPSNVLVNSDGDVKLCDFGVSGELVNSLANTFIGTRSYMAPERLLGNKYAVESDIWSLGVSLIEMATGHFPIPVESPPRPLVEIRRVPYYGSEAKDRHPMAIFELLAHIVEGDPPRLPKDQGFSEEFQDLVAKCLQKDPLLRPSLNDLLQHAWIRNTAGTPVDMAAWVSSTLSREALEEIRREKASMLTKVP